MDIPLPALLLSTVGAIFLIVKVVNYLIFLAETFAFKGISLKRFGAGVKGANGKRSGQRWAVITGPTSGIGQSFAQQLAGGKNGFNILLIGRRKEALETLETEIKQKYGVETKSVAIDLARTTAEDDESSSAWKMLETTLDTIDVGVLVNNAGVSHDMPVPFAESSPEEISSILQVNIHAVLRLTRTVLPRMIVAHRPALILNVGSFGAVIPSPYLSVYSGSKAFLATWSRCLAEEVKDQNIVVRSVIPAFVATKMSKIRKSSALVPTPDDFVRSTLGSIGLARGAQGRLHETTPYWSHAIMDYAITTFGLTNFAMRYNGSECHLSRVVISGRV